MRVAAVGNYDPPYSTENELVHAMGQHGFSVLKFQEGVIDEYRLLVDHALHDRPDFVLWTSTKSLRDQWGEARCWQLLAEARKAGVPVVGYHLDRWWGLERESSLDAAYFHCDLMVTADGGHDDMWPTKNINHRWLPPGVSERWCQPGTFREEYACDVVFVGSWQSYGHTAWTHRPAMINKLRQWYGSGFRCFPEPGQHAIRGLELNDVYWSAKVVVGDSCLVPNVHGKPIERYCSDRIPETLGRGGILVHPEVEGITDLFGWRPSWDLGDWRQLRALVDDLIALTDEDRLSWRQRYIDYVGQHHTYTVRVRQLIDIMREEKLL